MELRWHPGEQWEEPEWANQMYTTWQQIQQVELLLETLPQLSSSVWFIAQILRENSRHTFNVVRHQSHLHWMLQQIVNQHNSQLVALREGLQNQIPPLPTDPAELEAQIKQWAGEVVDERLAEEQTFRERVWQVCHEYFTWVFGPDTPIDAPGRAWVEWWWQSKWEAIQAWAAEIHDSIRALIDQTRQELEARMQNLDDEKVSPLVELVNWLLGSITNISAKIVALEPYVFKTIMSPGIIALEAIRATVTKFADELLKLIFPEPQDVDVPTLEEFKPAQRVEKQITDGMQEVEKATKELVVPVPPWLVANTRTVSGILDKWVEKLRKK